MNHRIAWVLGPLASVACSSGQDVKPSAGTEAVTTSAGHELAQLRAVPELRALLSGRSPFARTAGSFAATPKFRDGVAAQLTGKTLRLQAGLEPGASIEVEGLGEGWTIVDGTLRRSEPGTDLWLLAGDNRVEEVRVLTGPTAAHSFHYRLALGSSYSRVEVKDGVVVVAGAPGTPALVAARAWARDARGSQRWLGVEVQQQGLHATLRYTLDPTDLTYPVVVDPSWATLSSLSVARGAHGQTRLLDGRVLVVGGRNGTTIHSSAELLEVGKASVTVTPMKSARLAPVTMALSSGKVLVAGGTATDSYGGAISTAQIFDPAGVGSWSDAAPMTVPRANAEALLLPSGKVMVAGGSSSSTNAGLSTVEIYDPTLNSWSATGAMALPRFGFAMGLLPSGKVVVAGGRNSPAFEATANAETWDPATGTWSAVAPMAVTRHGVCATVLGDGRLLVAGGYDNSGAVYHASVTLFDGTSWSTPVTTMADPRQGCTATSLLDGSALITGGLAGAPGYVPSTSLFASGSITPGPVMTTARGSHQATRLLDGRVLVAGGLQASNAGVTSVELFKADKPDGASCLAAGECFSGNCVDGFCCNTACTGSCTACSAAKKGSGTNGTCGNMPAAATDSRCVAAAASTCGQTGTCTGGGACATYAAGTVCRAASCSGSTLTNQATCPGGGAACPGVTTLTCAGGCSGGACIDAGPAETGGDTGDAGDSGDVSDVSDASDGDVGIETSTETGPVDTGTTPPDTGATLPDTGSLSTDSSSPADTGSTETPPADSPGLCDCSTPGAGSTGNGRLAGLGLLGLLAFKRRKR